MSKTYSTEKNGTFIEIIDPGKPGIIEFWSTKHPESRYYDDRARSEILAEYEELKMEHNHFNAEISRLVGENTVLVLKYRELEDEHKQLIERLKAINTLSVA